MLRGIFATLLKCVTACNLQVLHVITFGQLKAVAKYSELASVPSTLNLREKGKT
jgi:hypothetical protein